MKRKLKSHRLTSVFRYALPLVICVLLAAAALAQEESSLQLNAEALDLNRQGKYVESVAVARHGLDLSKKVFGPYHDNTIESLNTLAEIYRSQGKFQRQEGLLKRILAVKTLSIGDKITEKEYAGIAGALRSLAKFYRDRRRYIKAEKVLRRAMNFEEKVRGEDYPERSDDLADMIGLLEAQGRSPETTTLYEKLLPALEKSGPAKDENVAKALGKLAGVYSSQKRYADAEGLLKRAIDITEKILGPDDRSLSVYLNNLAAVYSRQRKYADAEPLMKRALDIDRRITAKDSPDIVTDLNNLATIYSYEGKYDDAEASYKEALGMNERLLGPTHADIAKSLNNLATMVYFRQNRYQDAEPLLKRAIEIREDTVYLNNLAAVYSYGARYAEAEPLLLRALEIDKRSLGENNPDIAHDLNNLAVLYFRMGRIPEAEGLFHSALAIDEKSMGIDHPEVMADLNNLINLYESQNKDYEMIIFSERLLELYKSKGMADEATALEGRMKKMRSAARP